VYCVAGLAAVAPKPATPSAPASYGEPSISLNENSVGASSTSNATGTPPPRDGAKEPLLFHAAAERGRRMVLDEIVD
jgi:hypothetical protein